METTTYYAIWDIQRKDFANDLGYFEERYAQDHIEKYFKDRLVKIKPIKCKNVFWTLTNPEEGTFPLKGHLIEGD